MMPCPICGEMFNKGKGIYVRSETLGDDVLVCQKHESKTLSAEEEIAIQESLERATRSPEGHISKGQKIVKRSKIMEKYNIR